MTASIVEPIFEPRVIAHATSSVIILLNAMVITIALKALEECIRAVIITPITTLRRIENAPQLCIVPINESLDASKLKTSERPLSPMNKSPKPITASPMFLQRKSFNKVKKKPNPKIGIANAEILKLKPKRETIQAVIVVPIFAP